MSDTNLTPEQAEDLIAGTPGDQGFEDLKTVIESLRTYPSDQIDATLVDRIAAGAAGRASSAAMSLPLEHTGRTPFLSVSRQSFRRQIATVAATVTLLFAGGTSVAFAANGASPGDALYGIDRALETVGIADGGTQERLDEAENLVAKGDVAAGTEHASLAMAEATTGDTATDGELAASAALKQAAERAREAQSGQAETTKAGVAALLAYLAGNVGHVDGSTVAELAQDIGNGPSNRASDATSAAPGQAKTDSDSLPSGQGNAPGEPPGQSEKDPESPPADQGNAPDEPPGRSGASDPESPSPNQGKAPDEPPGQSKKNSEENAPASPPQSNSSNTSKPEKTK